MNWFKRNKLLVGILILTIGGYTAYQYAYQPHKTIEELDSNFKGNATEFLQKASQNFTEWNTKIVQLSGNVTAVDESGVTLENQIYCQFKDIDKKHSVTENENIQNFMF